MVYWGLIGFNHIDLFVKQGLARSRHVQTGREDARGPLRAHMFSCQAAVFR